MFLNLLGLAAAVFFAYALFTLFLQSVRSPSWFVKIFGGLLAGAATLLFAGLFVVGLVGMWQLEAPRAGRAVPDIRVEATPELVARGQVVAQSCVGCHSFDGSPTLNGGQTNLAPVVWGLSTGVVYAPNLTPGGELRRWSDGEIIRAVREGLDDRGVPLLHPAGQYRGLSDEDAAALVAYLRSQPELRHDQPRRSLNPVGLAAAAVGLLRTGEQPPLE
jgi:mono/diheme cytochrome c family protein